MSLVIAVHVLAAEAAEPIDPQRTEFEGWQYVNSSLMGSKPYTTAGVCHLDDRLYLRVEKLSGGMAAADLFVVQVFANEAPLAARPIVEAAPWTWGAYTVWAVDIAGSVPPWTIKVADRTAEREFGWSLGSYSVQRLRPVKL